MIPIMEMQRALKVAPVLILGGMGVTTTPFSKISFGREGQLLIFPGAIKKLFITSVVQMVGLRQKPMNSHGRQIRIIHFNHWRLTSEDINKILPMATTLLC